MLALLAKAIASRPWLVPMALLVIVCGIQTARVATSHAEARSAREAQQLAASKLAAEQAAAAANLAVVNELTARITAMTAQRELDKADAASRLAERDAAFRKATAEAANERTKRDQQFRATQSCDTLRTMRIDTCGPIADGLRKLAAANGGQNG